MKIPSITLTALIAASLLSAKVTNITPKAEDNTPPTGTVHFSGEAKQKALTPLAELLEIGSGVVSFVGSVTFEAEEEDTEKAAEDGSTFVTVERGRTSFPFEKGRYKLSKDLKIKSKTRIFAATDGSIVIQRGHSIRILPAGKISTVTGWLPDQAPPETNVEKNKK